MLKKRNILITLVVALIATVVLAVAVYFVWYVNNSATDDGLPSNPIIEPMPEPPDQTEVLPGVW